MLIYPPPSGILVALFTATVEADMWTNKNGNHISEVTLGAGGTYTLLVFKDRSSVSQIALFPNRATPNSAIIHDYDADSVFIPDSVTFSNAVRDPGVAYDQLENKAYTGNVPTTHAGLLAWVNGTASQVVDVATLPDWCKPSSIALEGTDRVREARDNELDTNQFIHDGYQWVPVSVLMPLGKPLIVGSRVTQMDPAVADDDATNLAQLKALLLAARNEVKVVLDGGQPGQALYRLAAGEFEWRTSAVIPPGTADLMVPRWSAADSAYKPVILPVVSTDALKAQVDALRQELTDLRVKVANLHPTYTAPTSIIWNYTMLPALTPPHFRWEYGDAIQNFWQDPAWPTYLVHPTVNRGDNGVLVRSNVDLGANGGTVKTATGQAFMWNSAGNGLGPMVGKTVVRVDADQAGLDILKAAAAKSLEAAGHTDITAAEVKGNYRYAYLVQNAQIDFYWGSSCGYRMNRWRMIDGGFEIVSKP